jgi:hypothetical protein
MLGSISETWHRGSIIVWAAVSWYSVGPIIAFHGQILEGIMWTDRLANQVRLMIQFSKVTTHQSTQVEQLSHCLNTMKMNFCILPGQHNQI